VLSYFGVTFSLLRIYASILMAYLTVAEEPVQRIRSVLGVTNNDKKAKYFELYRQKI